MKFLTIEESLQLQKSHRYFWSTQIIHKTEKAFKVRMKNNRDAMQEFWLPKSRMYFTILNDPNPGMEGKTLTKFFIPRPLVER